MDKKSGTVTRANNQHKRCNIHDYCDRGIYLITLCTLQRMPLLCSIEGTSDNINVIPSAVGAMVVRSWHEIPSRQSSVAAKRSEEAGFTIHREIQILATQLMPDHIHGILFVKETMDCSLGSVIRGFMSGTTSQYRKMTGNDSSLWESGFHDRILTDSGQLQRMIAYVHDNPRRYLLRRSNHDLFTIRSGIDFGNILFDAIGNISLLDRKKHAVHVRSHFTEQQAREYMNGCIVAGRHGASLIGAFISDREQQVLDVALREGLAVIVLVSEPFGEYYKPAGKLFDACASGMALILHPQAMTGTRHITRAECVQLNGIAEQMAH